MTPRNNSHRTCEMTSSSVNLQSSRWESLALTGGDGALTTTWTEATGGNKPSKLMRSLLSAPAFNSRLFESSSSRATLCASSLFRRRFCIPGSLDLSHSHVSNPGNHPVIDMKRRNNWEGIPKAVNLVNRTGGQNDRNLEPWMSSISGRTLRSCKTWSTGCPHRLRHQSRSRKLQRRFFSKISSQLARHLYTSGLARTYASRVAIPNHIFTSIMAEHPDLPFSIMSPHLSAIWQSSQPPRPDTSEVRMPWLQRP